MKSLRFIIAVVAALAVCTLTAVWVGNWELRAAQMQVEQLNKEKAQLIDYARRLMESRRVAQVRIEEQTRQPDGDTLTRLVWQEIGASGVLGRPLSLTVRGTQVYFEAYVLKFEPQFVGAADDTRMTTLALFRRVFGDQEEPRNGAEITRAARPLIGDAAQEVRYARMWDKFVTFVDQPREAEHYGIRVAQAEAPSIVARPGDLFELTLDAAGGLNVRRLADAR